MEGPRLIVDNFLFRTTDNDILQFDHTVNYSPSIPRSVPIIGFHMSSGENLDLVPLFFFAIASHISNNLHVLQVTF